MPKYIPPFNQIKQGFSLTGTNGAVQASIQYDKLLSLISLLLRAVEVDETWYLQTYLDIAEAVASGNVRSATSHFIDDGYFEGRLPFQLEVDEYWYSKTYPDIGAAIEQGKIESAAAHFREFGYLEGRLSSDIN
jgi:hypothetical protein